MKRRSRQLGALGSLWWLMLFGCGGAPAAPAGSPTSAVSAMPVEAVSDAPVAPQVGASRTPAQGEVLAPAASRAFGKVIDLEQWLEPWSFPAARQRPAPLPQRYERWRQQKQIDVGFSHLSMAEWSEDAQRLFAVSENEAKLRVYDARSGKLLAKNEITGYAQYGRGAFMWQPGASAQPAVLFAHDRGIEALDPLTGAPLRHLSDESAWQLRSSDDGAILGANLPNIDSQTSILVFYAWRPDGSLVPALALRFAERVDGFDLSEDKSLLAVSHYPSDTVSLLDLKNRRLVWTQPAPKYVSSVDISPDGAYVVAGGDAVVVYDAREPSRQSRFTDLGNNVHQVRFSPSGDALAASAYDGRARILRPAADGGPLKLLKLLKHTGAANVYAVSFTATGDRLLTSSGDKSVRIWGE